MLINFYIEAEQRSVKLMKFDKMLDIKLNRIIVRRFSMTKSKSQSSKKETFYFNRCVFHDIKIAHAASTIWKIKVSFNQNDGKFSDKNKQDICNMRL